MAMAKKTKMKTIERMKKKTNRFCHSNIINVFVCGVQNTHWFRNNDQLNHIEFFSFVFFYLKSKRNRKKIRVKLFFAFTFDWSSISFFSLLDTLTFNLHFFFFVFILFDDDDDGRLLSIEKNYVNKNGLHFWNFPKEE